MRRRTITRAAAMLAATVLLALGTRAQAASVDVTLFLVSGTISIPGLPTGDIELPSGSGITGTYDDVTGDFSGSFDLPATPFGEIMPGLCLQIGGSGTATGNISPADGTGAVTAVLDILLQIYPSPCDPVPAQTANCTLSLTLPLTTDHPGSPASPLPLADGTQIGLSAPDFGVPGVDCEDDNLEGIVNQIAGLPIASGASALIVFEVGPIPTPTTTTTASTTTTVPAAQPQTTQPAFTG